MADKRLNIKTTVDNRQARSAIQQTTKDMKNFGKQGAVSANTANKSLEGLMREIRRVTTTSSSSSKKMASDSKTYGNSLERNIKQLQRLRVEAAKVSAMSSKMGKGSNILGGGASGGPAGAVGGKVASLAAGGSLATVMAQKASAKRTLSQLNNLRYSLIDKMADPAAHGLGTESIAALQDLDNKIKDTTGSLKKMESPMKAVASQIAVLGAAIGAIGYAVYKFSKQAAELEQVRYAFDNLAASSGMTSEKIIKDLQAASAGMVKTSDLMKAAGRANLLGVPFEDMTKMMEIARATSRITGQTVTEAFNDITLAVGRQSKMILDNLGIIVDVEKANKEYAKTLGKQANDLTEAERKQAFMNATVKGGEALMAKLGTTTLTTAESFQALETEIGNLYDAFLSQFVPLAQGMADVMKRFREAEGFWGKFKSLGFGLTQEDVANMQKAAQAAQDMVDAKRMQQKDAQMLSIASGQHTQTKVAAPVVETDEIKAMREQLYLDMLRFTEQARKAEVEEAKLKYSKLEAEAKGHAETIKEINRNERLEIANINKKYDQEELERAKQVQEERAKLITQAMDKINAKVREQESLQADFMDKYKEATMSAYDYEVDRLEQQAAKFRELLNTKQITQEQYNAWYKNSLAGLDEDQLKIAEGWKEIQEEISSGASEALFDWIDGVHSAEYAFRQFASTFLKDIAQMIMQQTILNALQGNTGKSAGGGSDSWWGAATNIIGSAVMGAMAAGGPVAQNKPYLVGESGPEVFTPSSAGHITPNNRVMGGNQVQNNISVAVDASGSNATEEQSKSMANQVSMAIEAKMNDWAMKNMRPGGMFNRGVR